MKSVVVTEYLQTETDTQCHLLLPLKPLLDKATLLTNERDLSEEPITITLPKLTREAMEAIVPCMLPPTTTQLYKFILFLYNSWKILTTRGKIQQKTAILQKFN
ncbi:hypothetical protein PanWU01x14_104550 [Parasponia andersonii]|uniref:Uncharacterized protein n=1 Tax=Parasponia andersonii TaxID=3476 RepID=A0A2P5D1W9_PARAD|nr:hypothetical protein PanWU01x14_104550 [Parasponia andersonii]